MNPATHEVDVSARDAAAAVAAALAAGRRLLDDLQRLSEPE
jgi:hypothetical protein